MEKVLGFGGFFFRAGDPRALADWYETHLGVDPVPSSYDGAVWTQEAGPTVFAPFPRDKTYFGRNEQSFMLNFRVRDLAAMIEQLRKAGIEVVEYPENPLPNGVFARIHDPEGNPIELWEPR